MLVLNEGAHPLRHNIGQIKSAARKVRVSRCILVQQSAIKGI